MPKTRKTKQAKQTKSQAELSETQLEGVSGGIIAVHPVGSSRADEGPEESITFVYGKLGVKYTPQT
jgi:hypothetical protein